MSVSLLDNLTAGRDGWCEVHAVSSGSFTLFLMDNNTFKQYGQLLSTLSDVCNSLPANVHFKPGARELIVAKSPAEDWQRGYVISTQDNTFHIAMIDIGETEKLIKNVHKLPTQFHDIPALGVNASVIKFMTDEQLFTSKHLKIGQLFKYLVTSRHSTGCVANLYVESEKVPACQVSLERWVPRFEDRGLKAVTLKDGASVDVLSYADARAVFVRPMDDGFDAMWQTITQRVGAHCLTAPFLSRLPAKGELLASRYEMDGNFYRAVVLAVDADQVLVSYVDFGNKEYVKLDGLKPLSQELKEIPCMAVLVELRSVTREHLNCKAALFLDGIVASHKLLTAKLEGGLPVDLVLSDKKTTVSALLNRYLEPVWKTCIAEGRKPAEATLFGNALEDMHLPAGRPLTLTVLHAPSWDSVWACAKHCAAARHVLAQLHQDIAEYVAAIPDRPYMPRKNELCLLLVDGRWVRGVCLNYENLTVFAHLVDFGPTIEIGHHCVRKMCEDFLWPNAIAVLCVIEGLPEVKSPALLSRIKELVPEYSNHVARVDRVSDETFHHIVMPELLRTLETEGFLPGKSLEASGKNV